jgi:heterodisulfide reductase subunit D
MAFDYKQYFGEILTAQDLVTRPEERTWRLAAPGRDAEHHDVVLYLGCNVLRTSHMIKTVTAIFDRLGVDYIAVGGPTYCCGIVHHQNGDTAASTGMNRRTLEHFQRYTPQEVVMWCPSCIYFYDEVQQLDLPFPVSHTAEYLVRRLDELPLAPVAPRRVALHGHGTGEARLREGEAGRRLLAAVPGITLVDLPPDPRFGRSCNPALMTNLGPEGWRALALGELDRAIAAGAETLAGMYHGCQRQLCPFEAERPIVLEHYLTVFGRALGIEFEDTFKKYRLWADPERIFADSTPCQQANGLDPAKARELIDRTFVPLGSVGRAPGVGT